MAAGLLLTVKNNGAQTWEPLFEYDAAKQELVPRTVGFERVDEEYYLVLFGSGIRGYQQPLIEAYGVRILGQVQYAGSQLTLAGLDQVNIRLSKELAGSGLVIVTLQFSEASIARFINTVEVKIGGIRTTN